MEPVGATNQAGMEAVSDELDYWPVDYIQTAIKKSGYEPVNPLAALQDGAPVEFFVSGASNLYNDLNDSIVGTVYKIVKADGSDVTDDDVQTAPVNNIAHSMWANMDFELNGVTVSQAGQHYPYRAYLETLLSYQSNSLDNRHIIEGWDKDDTGEMEEFDATKNDGFKRRRDAHNKSTHVVVYFRPRLDIFHQPRLIPANINMKLRLIPAKSKFALVQKNGVADHKLKIVDCKFWVLRKLIAPEMFLAHTKMREKKNMRIPYTKVQTKHLTLVRGQMIQ